MSVQEILVKTGWLVGWLVGWMGQGFTSRFP